MEEDAPVYGLDIESDTTVDGLDPSRSSIVAVAVAGSDWTTVLHADDGGEATMLLRLDALLGELTPGVIVTWNGSRFDLPFLADRAAALGVSWSLRLSLDDRLTDRDPLPGHAGGYVGSWGRHRHLDGYRLYRADVGRALPVSCGLKSLARLVGLVPVEVDRSAIHELSRAELDAYVGSDAELARLLVMRRFPAARRHLDPVVLTHGSPSGTIHTTVHATVEPVGLSGS